MNCKKCGTPLMESDLFCKNCGEPVDGTGEVEKSTNTDGHNPNYQQQNNSSNAKHIAIGVVIIVLVIIILFLVGMFIINKDSKPKDGSDGEPINTVTPNVVEPNTNKPQSKFYKVRFEDFTFKIPDNLICEENMDLNALSILNEDDTWIVYLGVEKGSFAKLLQNMDLLPSAMKQQNSLIDVSAAIEKKIGGVDFITMQVTDSASGQTFLSAWTKLNAMYFGPITVVSLNEGFDYSVLEIIAPIINSAEYADVKTNIEVSTNLNMEGITKLAQ